ncbi:MAG: AMP-binding protein [Chloroflexi bacterium]|nr:AMP-binding protein [Chloroflexota bacterium]
MLPTDRFPLITERGHRLLRRLEEHLHAPRFTHRGYNRLTAEGLRRARAFAEELKITPPTWRHGEVPDWLAGFVERCFREVPIYRRLGPPGALSAVEGFFDLPTTDRSDLNREPWAFLPDSQSLDGLIVYNTSGTTGHPLDILTHPDTLGLYVPLLQAALATHNITLEGGPERVAVALVCFQKRTYTYATVSALLDQGGFVKVNLSPDEWRDPGDRARFLNDLQPEIYTGDPISFAELAKLPLAAQPKALVSTAMTLTPAWRESLEARFGCPVIDLYSMNEAGPIAVGSDFRNLENFGSLSGYTLLQPRLYVEILNEDGSACAPGERGEVTLSGGFNPFLPLLRYRTGDFATLEFRGGLGRHLGRHAGLPLLVGLEGRSPVVFRARDGQPVNNVDVSIALRALPISQFNLHQFADGSLRLGLRGTAGQHEARRALLDLFGPEQLLTIAALESDDKVVQYTADLPKEAIEQNGK